MVTGAAVGAVEARPLERDADRAEHLAQRAPALLTRGEGIVGERLHDLGLVAAFLAPVLVGGHLPASACRPLALATVDCQLYLGPGSAPRPSYARRRCCSTWWSSQVATCWAASRPRRSSGGGSDTTRRSRVPGTRAPPTCTGWPAPAPVSRCSLGISPRAPSPRPPASPSAAGSRPSSVLPRWSVTSCPR